MTKFFFSYISLFLFVKLLLQLLLLLLVILWFFVVILYSSDTHGAYHGGLCDGQGLVG